MSEELKPCPFCGGEAKFGTNKSCCGKTVRIDCTNPECGACVTAFSSKLYAAKAWNRRAQQPNEPLTCDGCAYKKDYGKCAACDYCIRHEGYKDRYNVRPPEAGEAE